MTSTERAAYQAGRIAGRREAEQRIERRINYMPVVNGELIGGISGSLTEAEARAFELHERHIKGL